VQTTKKNILFLRWLILSWEPKQEFGQTPGSIIFSHSSFETGHQARLAEYILLFKIVSWNILHRKLHMLLFRLDKPKIFFSRPSLQVAQNASIASPVFLNKNTTMWCSVPINSFEMPHLPVVLLDSKWA